MNIAFDIRGISGDKGGKGVWTANVLKSILSHDSLNTYYLFTKHDPAGYFNRPQVHVVQLGGFGPLWHYRFYRAMLRLKIDIYLATESYIVPAFHDPKRLKVGVVIHDLIAFKKEIQHQKKAKWIEQLTLKRAITKAKWIFTVSAYTKRDLMNQYPELALAQKSHVVYAGTQDVFLQRFAEDEISATQKKYMPDEPYLMMTGALEPRKNAMGAVQAYYLLNPHLQKRYRLVISGKKGPYYHQVMALVYKLGLKERVTFLEYLPERDLAALIQGSHLFLFPSFYEGFGLPVLEAMQAGIPVVTSRVSSLPELAMDAVQYVDPHDPIDMADGISQVLESEERIRSLRQKGLEQVKHFSWGKTAQRILDVITK